MSQQFDPILKSIQEKLGEILVSHTVRLGELTVEVNAESIRKVLTYFRDNSTLNFRQLIDICGADYPERFPRFEVVYHLLSLKHNHRIRVKVRLDEGEAIDSVTNVFAGANWFEREVWDMYGIPFNGHPDLRRLLSDYTFEGHPLRKDFPLTGYQEVRYDEVTKKVMYEPVNLQQAYRNFDYLSPWEGMTPTLPGDEKATKGEGNPEESTDQDNSDKKQKGAA